MSVCVQSCPLALDPTDARPLSDRICPKPLQARVLLKDLAKPAPKAAAKAAAATAEPKGAAKKKGAA